MAIESITKTLGTGSGIDTAALVTALVEAQFAGKTAALTARSDKLTAQISEISKVRGAITGFDTALASLIAGGTLASKLTSSNEGAVKAVAVAGGPSKLSASVGVTQLASAQVSSTDTGVARGTAFRTGTLTLRLGRDTTAPDGTAGFAVASSQPIEIGPDDATLDGIAAKINAAKAGVTASIVTDGEGARLVLRGATGAAQAFELDAADAEGAEGASLAMLTVGRGATGTSSGTRARDAIVQVDGVRYTRASNAIEGVVPGVTLQLSAVTTSPAMLSMTRATTAVTGAVNDVVATFNELMSIVKTASDPVSGALRGDAAVATLGRNLRGLTTAVIGNDTTPGAPRTLADLGVATARDGTLSVDVKRLATAATDFPAAVESMFAAGSGLSAALSSIAKRATDRTAGLDAASARYTRDVSTVATAKLDLSDKSEVARTRLSRQFASMDSRVAAYKSTQTFLQNQIDAWNKAD